LFAELAAIGSALSTINSLVSQYKETKANAQDAARLLGKFSETSAKLDKWEKKTKLKRPLTPKEAMDLSIQRRKIKNTETQIKDICLMSGCIDIWQDAQRIRAQSEKEHQQYLKTVHIRRQKRRKKIRQISIVVLIVVFTITLGVTGYGSKWLYEQYKIQEAKQELKQKRRILRNIRECGRQQC
jgi:uncharacterized membrane protein|tara:strand:- start:2040 stop:2591 length:552 start_codon:yes stop_codon:yes gene_type:complete